MPETLADLAKNVLHCYHHTARYQLADVAQAPWDQEAQYGGNNSGLIRIRYLDASSGDVYEMNVGLVARRGQIRTAVVSDNSPTVWDSSCALEKWTTLEP
jgi:hypothetical protein